MVKTLSTTISINNITFEATDAVIDILKTIHLNNLTESISLIECRIKHLEEVIESQLTYTSTNESICSLRRSNEFELAKYKQLKIEIEEFKQ